MPDPLHINGSWRISADASNYVLEERGEKEGKAGEFWWYPRAYCGSLAGCLIEYLHGKPRKTDGPLLDAIRDTCLEVKKLLEHINQHLTVRI